MTIVKILLDVVRIVIGLALAVCIVYNTVLLSYKMTTDILTKRMADLHNILEIEVIGHAINLMEVSFTLMFTLGFTLVELKILFEALTFLEQIVHV